MEASGADQPIVPTHWDVRRDGKNVGLHMSAKGRRYTVSDLVNLPPPVPNGSVWKVIAVDPPETEGCDGTITLELAQAADLRRAEPR
jgi:hypothetical protein